MRTQPRAETLTPKPPDTLAQRHSEAQPLRNLAADSKPPADLSLLHGIRAGERDALKLFFLRWNDSFCRIATHILRNRDAAEDAASEAILRIYRLASCGSFPADADDATRWITRQARNCAFRQRGRAHLVHSEWVDRLPAFGTASDEDEVPEHDIRYSHIERALQRLPRKVRNAIQMRFLEELSYTEIAAKQGGTAAGARNRVDRGILHITAIIHSRRGARTKAENVNNLSPKERAHILNSVAIARSWNPNSGLRWLAAEVCRQTGIFIDPDSTSAVLLDHPQHGRV